MTSEIIIIRVKQISRIAIQIGIFRVLFLLGLLAFAILLLFSQFVQKSYQELIIGLFALSVLSIHLKRRDKEFIHIYASVSQSVFFVEYILLSIPLIVILLYFNLWSFTLLYLLALLVISSLDVSLTKTSINSVFQRILPDDNFEWKSGIRKNIILISIVWVVSFVTSFFTASVPIAIFILGVIILNFYEKPEPLQILLASELNAKKFLIRKLQSHSFAFLVLIAPLVISFSVFNLEYYYISLIEYALFAILLIYTILLKYAFYCPNEKSGAMQIFTMFGVISIFIPIFIPVIIVLSVKFIFQAANNLNIYLNDFN